MLKLYFGNLVNTVTTLLLVVLLGFIGVSICHRATITGWGRRTLLALVLGLVICCFAVARDGLDKTIQNAIDGSCAPGLFSLISIPTLAGCVGAFLILLGRCGHPLHPLPTHAGGVVLRPVRGGAAEGGHSGGVPIFGVTPLQVNDRSL